MIKGEGRNGRVGGVLVEEEEGCQSGWSVQLHIREGGVLEREGWIPDMRGWIVDRKEGRNELAECWYRGRGGEKPEWVKLLKFIRGRRDARVGGVNKRKEGCQCGRSE